MSTASIALPAIRASAWAHRFRLDRPHLGPLVIGLLALCLFHVTVGLVRPEYWFTQPAWDEAYYVHIARGGYSLPGDDYGRYSTLPFSPGWPLLLRAVSFVTLFDPLAVRLPLSALLFLGSCQALGWTLRAFSPDHVRNNLTVLFAALWPGSLYLCTAYAEALYWPLLLLCFGCMLRRRWFGAAVLAALCWFTRTPAVVVVCSLAAAIVLDGLAGRSRAALLRAAVTLLWALPLAALGLFGYVAMTWAVTGDWSAFSRSYVAWEPCEVLTLRSVTFRTLGDALERFPTKPTVSVAAAWFLLAPFLIILQRRRMPAVLSIFAAGTWLFFLVNDWEIEPYHDMLRWLSVVFPLHYAIVTFLEQRRPGLRIASGAVWLLGSMAMYAWCVHRFVCKQWVS